jgi:hypothetical protein
MALWRRRRASSAALVGLFLLFGTAAAKNEEAVEARMRKDITFLASDECEGRGVETRGIQKAADHIAAEFARAGLKPGGPDGSFFQPFTIFGQSKLEGKSVLKLKGPLGQEIDLKLDADFQVMGLSGSGKVTAPLVFVGFGATAPDIGYDDYKGIDVTGKIVVMLRHTPRWNSKELPFDGPRKDEHAGLERKQGLAESNKAVAVLLVNDLTEAPAGDRLMPFGYVASASPGSVPALHVRRAVIDMVLQSSLGTLLADVERAIDRDLQPRSTPLPGWTAAIETDVKRIAVACKNVIGVVDGSGPLAKETVVVGAHYDHLGYGGRGSRSKESAKKEIHHGADDNASGTTSVVELARRFGALKERQGRRLVFITFSAEEMGLLGSRHYCNKEPLFPLTDTVAMVNLDMVGRFSQDKDTGKGKLMVEGVGTAKTFEKMIDRLNPGFLLTKKAGGTGPSDHDSFYRKKIPVVFFWTGLHADYHKPTDTSDKINVSGMRQIADLAEKVILTLASDPQRPEYVQVASSFTPSTAGKGPRLGIMPNYDETKEGVLVGGLTDGGPAAKGGLKAGDLIVELAGKSVKNLNTYMVIMAQQRSGQALEVGVLRDGKKLKLKVVPQ